MPDSSRASSAATPPDSSSPAAVNCGWRNVYVTGRNVRCNRISVRIWMAMIAMEQNFFYRSALQIACALLAVLFLPSLVRAVEPDANSGMKGSDTPQALLATYHNALARREWQTCFLCCAPKMRAELFSMLCYEVGMSRDAKLAEINARLNASLKKSLGTKSANAEEAAIAKARRESRADKTLRMYEMLEKQLDVPGFVDEICRRVDPRGQRPFPDLFPDFGDVKNITIQGDKAVGYLQSSMIKQHQQAPADNRQPVHFCKIDGRWYLTILDPPPPLLVSERATKLQEEIDTLWVLLCCSTKAVVIPAEAGKPNIIYPRGLKPYGELRMSVRPFVYKSAGPTVHLARLSPTQAKKLIEYLSTEGFLQQAVELGKQVPPDRDLSENCYTLQVSTQNLRLHEELSWGANMLKRLDGLRGAFDGEGARAMDAILAELADERKQNGVR